MAKKKPVPAKKAAPVKKAAPAKKTTPVKKAAPAKKEVAPVKKAVPAKKAAPIKKEVPAKKAAPAKKEVPAKKAAPAKKVAPVKKAAPAKKNTPTKKVAEPKKVLAVKKEAVVKATKPEVVKAAKKVIEKPAKPAKPVKPAKPAKVAAVKEPKAPAKPKAPSKPVFRHKEEPRVIITASVTPVTAKKTLGEKFPQSKTTVIAHRHTSELQRKTKDVTPTAVEISPSYNRSLLDTLDDSAPRLRYSDEKLGDFKSVINKKLEVARKELGFLQGLITRKDEAGTEDTENKFASMEDGSASQDREMLNQLASRQITLIEKLEQALGRVENKTYGICRKTGKLIEEARLKAVPHATLSMEAKMVR